MAFLILGALSFARKGILDQTAAKPVEIRNAHQLPLPLATFADASFRGRYDPPDSRPFRIRVTDVKPAIAANDIEVTSSDGTESLGTALPSSWSGIQTHAVQLRIGANPTSLTSATAVVSVVELSKTRAVAMTSLALVPRNPIGVQSMRIQKLAASVGLATFLTASEDLLVCSASLVTPSIVMTNNHCLEGVDEPRNGNILFDYNDEQSVVTKRWISARISPDAVTRDRWARLDVAFLSLDKPLQRQCVTPSLQAPVVGETLVLIGHAQGRTKEVSLVDCRVTRSGDPDDGFQHTCNTDDGSSGSPLFDFRTGSLLGLHRRGFTLVSTNDNQALALIALKDDGALKSVWEESNACRIAAR